MSYKMNKTNKAFITWTSSVEPKPSGSYEIGGKDNSLFLKDEMSVISYKFSIL